ncbi:MAG: glucose-1-phosphate thymidylyltransferase [uncultured bacterium]|nr:MAG: glucose-1-phosphate thymidylyltransferase [uncultured bacterium]HBD05004.1 glucose-1-phosphate thymidylyltransferase [Candidatus Uhrbacteria bacterium]
MKGLIAAGGRATRFRPITWSMNKHVLPIAGKPMILYAVENLIKAGITDIAININLGDKDIEQIVGDGSSYGAHITYLEQAEGALGVAHVVYNAREFLGNDSFVYHLGDNIFREGIKQAVDKFNNENLNCMLTLSRAENLHELGVARFNDKGEIIEVIEKPQNPPSDFAVTGVYIYDNNFFKAFESITPSARGEYEISDIHTWYLKQGMRVGHQVIDGWWKDPGRPKQLLDGNVLAMNSMAQDDFINAGELKDGVEILGNVKIGSESVIGPNVLIRGPVIIGSGVKISNAYIGPYTSIGNGAVIDQTEVEHSIVLDGASIRCGKRLSGSVIGRNACLTSVESSLPKSSHAIVIGDNSSVEL